MPTRALAVRELSHLMAVLSHPHRLRIVLELRGGEADVTTLQKSLGTSHSAVSQQLAMLRAHRLVEERREGRHVYYHVVHGGLPKWILAGLKLAEEELSHSAELKAALEDARELFSTPGRRKMSKS